MFTLPSRSAGCPGVFTPSIVFESTMYWPGPSVCCGCGVAVGIGVGAPLAPGEGAGVSRWI